MTQNLKQPFKNNCNLQKKLSVLIEVPSRIISRFNQFSHTNKMNFDPRLRVFVSTSFNRTVLMICMLLLSCFIPNTVSADIDSNRVNFLINEVKKVLFNDQHQAIDLCDEILEQAKDGYHNNYLAEAHRYKGVAYDILGEYERSMSEYDRAENYAVLSNDTVQMANCWVSKGIIHHRLENYQLALEYYLKGLDVHERYDNEMGVIGTSNNIGVVYNKLNMHEAALELYQENLIKAGESADMPRIAAMNNNLGETYLKLGKLDKALEALREAIKINVSRNDNYSLGTSFKTYVMVWNELEQYDSALYYNQKSLELGLNKEHPIETAEAKLAEGDIYLNLRKYEKTISTLDTVRQILSDQLKHNELNYQYHILNAWAFDSLDNQSKAAFHYRKANIFRDSIAFEETSKKLLSVRLEKSSKEFEYKARLADQHQEELIEQNETQQKWLIVNSVVLVSLLIVVFTLYKSWNLRAKYNEILSVRNDELEADIKSTDRMLRVLAHDFRSPLATLKMAFEYLSKPDLSYEERVELSEKSNKHLNTTLQEIDQLLFWLMRDKKILNPELIDLTHAIDSAEEIHQYDLQDKKVEVVRENIEGVKILFDKINFQVLCRNIVHNSIKYMGRGGQLTVKYSETDDQSTIEFQDNGFGMTPDLVDKINAKAFSEIRPESNKGTGVGIELIFEIVAQNGGLVHYESELEKGTSVIITLPKFRA